MFYLSYKEPGNFHRYEQVDGYKVREFDNMLDVVLACQNYVWSPIRWRLGIRKQDRFISANLCVFDFDEGLSVEEARENVFADSPFVICTTKSHRKEKDGKPACDRFRVTIPFESEIKSLDDYKFSMKRLARDYGADPSCVDGARFFWPHEDCEWWLNEDGCELMPVTKAPEFKAFNEPVRLPEGELPFWAGWFLNTGEKCSGSGGRNDMVMRIVRWAKQNGWASGQIRERILSGAFDRTGFEDSEVDEIINKTYR